MTRIADDAGYNAAAVMLKGIVKPVKRLLDTGMNRTVSKLHTIADVFMFLKGPGSLNSKMPLKIDLKASEIVHEVEMV